MQLHWELMIGLLLGIGLSAAAGFRLFLPPLVLSAAGLYFHMPLPSQIQWMGTEAAFFIFLAATLFEIGAYYVPWLDNLLDHIATPAAVIAGTLITSPFIGDLDPVWRWSLALLAGGTAAGAVQSLTHLTRLSSSLITGGLANPVIATVENILSLFLSISTLVFPVLTVLIILVALFVGFKISKHFKKRAA